MLIELVHKDTKFIVEASHVAISALLQAGFKTAPDYYRKTFSTKRTGYINPFDLYIFRKRVADNPTLITEVEHILSMWESFYNLYLKKIEELLKKGQNNQSVNSKLEINHVMEGFLSIATINTRTFHLDLEDPSVENKLRLLLFHPQYEVREIVEVIWKSIYNSSQPFKLYDALLGLKSKYLEDTKVSTNYRYVSEALSGIGYKKTTEDILNVPEANRFEMSKEKAGYTKYSLKNFDMIKMYSVLKKNDLLWILEERPQGVQLPEWLTEFGTISINCVLDFASVLELQEKGIGHIQTPLINFRDITIHPWYYMKVQNWFKNNAESITKDFEEALVLQIERIVDLTEHTPIQNSVSWMTYSQYLMPLSAMCLCSVTCSLPELTTLAEDLSADIDNPILRSLGINTCEFLSQNFNSFTTYPIIKSDELRKDSLETSISKKGNEENESA